MTGGYVIVGIAVCLGFLSAAANTAGKSRLGSRQQEENRHPSRGTSGRAESYAYAFLTITARCERVSAHYNSTLDRIFELCRKPSGTGSHRQRLPCMHQHAQLLKHNKEI
jgi:hypothetical protein